MLISDLDPARLHHAYVIAGTSSGVQNDLEQFIINKLGIPFHGNPDVFLANYASIGIDDLSETFSMHQRVPIGPKKIIILSATGITMQAQNSILKMIEEPTQNTHFFFILPSAALLLPTVLSRVHLIEAEEGEKAVSPKVKAFITATIPERLEIVKEMIGEVDKERITKEEVFQYISAVITLAHEKDKSVETLTVLSRVSEYLRDPSASLKLIFEYLALKLKV